MAESTLTMSSQPTTYPENHEFILLVLFNIVYSVTTVFIHSDRVIKIWSKKISTEMILLILWINDLLLYVDFLKYLSYSMYGSDENMFAANVKINITHSYYLPCFAGLALTMVFSKFVYQILWKKVRYIALVACIVITFGPWFVVAICSNTTILIFYTDYEADLPQYCILLTVIFAVYVMAVTMACAIMYKLWNYIHQLSSRKTSDEKRVKALSFEKINPMGSLTKNDLLLLAHTSLNVKEEHRDEPPEYVPMLHSLHTASQVKTTENNTKLSKTNNIINNSDCFYETPESKSTVSDGQVVCSFSHTQTEDIAELSRQLNMMLSVTFSLLLTLPFLVFFLYTNLYTGGLLNLDIIWSLHGLFIFIFHIRPLLLPFLWDLDIIGASR